MFIFAAERYWIMEKSDVINRIRRVAETTLPPNSSLILYGSRARGDADEYSDWDLLVLLDKPELVAKDYGLTYPFRLLGWDLGEDINPTLYTKKQWNSWTYLPFYKNVERDKVVIL
jgi:predicted nucleotidyltransferase